MTLWSRVRAGRAEHRIPAVAGPWPSTERRVVSALAADTDRDDGSERNAGRLCGTHEPVPGLRQPREDPARLDSPALMPASAFDRPRRPVLPGSHRHQRSTTSARSSAHEPPGRSHPAPISDRARALPKVHSLRRSGRGKSPPPPAPADQQAAGPIRRGHGPRLGITLPPATRPEPGTGTGTPTRAIDQNAKDTRTERVLMVDLGPEGLSKSSRINPAGTFDPDPHLVPSRAKVVPSPGHGHFVLERHRADARSRNRAPCNRRRP